jgi:hypothetical protein
MRSKNLDAQLAERAIRLGWVVPAALRGACVKTLWELAKNENASPRERISAIKALMTADQREEAAIQTVMAVDLHAELRTRLEALEQNHDEPDHPRTDGGPAPQAGDQPSGDTGGA